METKKVWCVTNGVYESINLYEKRVDAKRLFASSIKEVINTGGKIITVTSIKDETNKKYDYFSIFVETNNKGYYWIKCQEKEIH